MSFAVDNQNQHPQPHQNENFPNPNNAPPNSDRALNYQNQPLPSNNQLNQYQPNNNQQFQGNINAPPGGQPPYPGVVDARLVTE